MSKRRPDTVKRPRSYWPTPPAAVEPLLPHLAPGTRFIEPCAGDGSLIRALEAAGHVCEFASDLEPQAEGIHAVDALEVMWPADALVITNPPWERHLLHPMIDLWPDCWMLYDANWVWTKRARPYAARCSLIVPVGRIKWIPDSPHSSMDDCAWFRFTAGHTEGPRIYVA
jgi:hypothetical protein